MSTSGLPVEEAVTNALAKVNQIDLSPINEKLQHENPVRWTDEALAQAETNYRRYLALNLLYPSETLSVNKDLDDYWHQHILDTRKYAADCETVFGYFLHHYPYFGMQDGQEQQQNMEAFALTQQLWEETFCVSLINKTNLTLDRILGAYEPEPTDRARTRVHAFPQNCKSGQHCSRAIDQRINPVINPLIKSQINPRNNPQINPRNNPPNNPRVNP